MPAGDALDRLITAHGHCLIVAEMGAVVGLVTLADLQRALAAGVDRGQAVKLIDCRRGDLVWLPLQAHLDRLEDQLTPNGLRQLPVFDVPSGKGGVLPHGLPSSGLPVSALKGMASRDGMARALARRLQTAESVRWATSASATGST
jgi:hypothetical protein